MSLLGEEVSPGLFKVTDDAETSPDFAEFPLSASSTLECLLLTGDETVEEADDETLSLLQLESGQGARRTAIPRTPLSDACAPAPRSLLQPKSGLRMLSMKKFVVLCVWCAADGEGRETVSSSL